MVHHERRGGGHDGEKKPAAGADSSEKDVAPAAVAKHLEGKAEAKRW